MKLRAIPVLFLFCALSTVHCPLLFCQTLTTVSDTLVGPGATGASGSLIVTAPVNFTSAAGANVESGLVAGPIAITNGAFSVALVPNAGCTSPLNSSGQCSAYYIVQYVLSATDLYGNSTKITRTENWVVPATGTANLAAVRAALVAAGLTVPFVQITPPAGCSNNELPEWTSTGWTCTLGGAGTPGGSSGQIQYNNSGAFGGFTLGGDCSFAVPNITCTKTNGNSFGTLALSSAALAQSISNATHKWLNSYNASTGAFTQTQPADTDLTGTTNNDVLVVSAGAVAESSAPTIAVTNMTGAGAFNTSGNAGTATNLSSYPTTCSGGQFSQGLSSGSNNCGTPSGTISGLTTGYIPKASSSTGIVNSAFDDGVTTANTATYSGSGGMSAAQFGATGSTSGLLFVCQADQSPASGSVGIVPPTSCSSGYGTFTLPTLPSSAGVVLAGAASSNNSALSIGTVPNSDLTNSLTTVNSQSCTLGSSCTIPFQTEGTANTSQAGLNFITSTTNSIGLTATPSNPGTNQEKVEIAGTYSGSLASGTGLTAGQVPALSGSTALGGLTVPSSAGNATFTQTIWSGTLTLSTTAITSGACQAVSAGSVNSVAASGVATTDTIIATPNASWSSLTGIALAGSGGWFVLDAYPTSGYVNVDVCNSSPSSVGPPSSTVLNIRVVR